ncbi:MAG: sigma-54-dependent Fis family transcriptional regulator [Deltaproteobacteria bacterium]|nr:sigma-54-dependent Fis family transcriptional regulator [Deltaproteobacteria bacterium]MCW5803344.1 sigma-54-dependent Fis family transcriptional regulator [Deltaproteobacteria bacterium]
MRPAIKAIEDRLHAARPGTIEAELVAIALDATAGTHGALFVWDKGEHGLALVHHVVDGVTVTLPRVIKHEGDARTAGIALHVFDGAAAYLCPDTSRDPRYTRYLSDVGAIAAAPVQYQQRPIGVVSVATREPRGLDAAALRTLTEIAEIAAPLLRRAQVDRASRAATGRPLVIKGLSPAWHEVERKLELAAPTNAPILIRGESGTGKDLVARAIHWNSRRTDEPYIVVNCAAIPETLLESILFGHVKGAFTGASFHKVGEFQKADGGTLFLDEVGELPVMLQAKVLRAVEQGEVQPLGSNEPPDRVDVRLICATNRDLEGMARTGAFRDDLYYRLSVMTLELPSLRSYKDNLETLANVFLEQAAAAHGKPAPRLGTTVLARMAAYDFPGNVRELKNTIEHALILCTGDELRPEDLPKPFQSASSPAPRAAAAQPTLDEARESWLAPLEKQYLTDLLARHHGNVELAARAAGVNKVTLYRLLKRRGLHLGRTVGPKPD